jgi:two-component system heavy metal sensor histidine kinase CusS
MPYRRSLRYRLTLWNTGVIAVALILMLLGARAGVTTTEYGELDDWLMADALEISHQVETLEHPKTLVPFVQERAKFRVHQQYFVVYQGTDPNLTWSTDGVPDQFKEQCRSFRPPYKDWGEFRIAMVRVDRKELEGTLFIGASTNQITEDIDAMDRSLLWVGGIALFLTPILAWGLAGLALRPVDEMILLARELQPQQLHQRLPQGNNDDELDRLAGSVNGLLERVGVYVTERKEMLASAAHELRTPLAAIRSTAEVALGQKRSPEEYQERLAQIIEQGGTLEQLINQVLILAETEGDDPISESEALDLCQLIDRSHQMFQSIADSKEITFQWTGQPALVWGNRRFLSMMANNLIDNALKFTPNAGTVNVTLTSSSTEPDVVLTVSDTGMGIEAVDLPRIFERFFRTDRARQRDGKSIGNGLGLSLVEAIVQKHGGRIDVTSQPGVGTVFTVRLPRHEALSETPQTVAT